MKTLAQDYHSPKCSLIRLIPWLIVLFLSTPAVQGQQQAVRKPEIIKDTSAPSDRETSPGNVALPRASAAYRLNPSDLISVTVFEEPELTASVRLSEDGTIVLPLLGAVKVAGKSVKEATDLVTELYRKDYLVSPVVAINVLELKKARFSVLGQVAKPGTYEIPIEDTMPLMDAIAMAGGYTRLASPSKITIKRGMQVFKVNGKDEASESKASPFRVQAGDIITVAESLF